MTIAYWSILATIFIPLFCVGYAKLSQKGYDNSNPREFLSKLEGKAQRANHAQQNSYEVFPPFAAAVIIAHQLHAQQSTVDILAVIFVIARILYCLCYIYNKPSLRTLMWFIGFIMIISLFLINI